MNNSRVLKDISIVVVLFVLLTVLFTFPLVLNMNSGVYGPFFKTDLRGNLWTLWWEKKALADHLDPGFCPYIGAPYGTNLEQLPVFSLIKAVERGFLLVFEPIFAFNLLVLISFVLTGVFAYALMFFLTQDRRSSFLAAAIFTFSPYHMSKVMSFGFVFLGNWVALFFLAFFYLRSKPGILKAVLAGIAYSVLLSFNPYYGYFTMLLLACFLVFYSFYGWRRNFAFLKTGDARSEGRPLREILRFPIFVIISFFVAALINIQSLIHVLKNLFSKDLGAIAKGTLGYVRSFDYLFAQSARPLSYLLPASTHPLFGTATKKMFGSFFYGRGFIEQTLYLGWVPILLAFFAFRLWRRNRLHPKLNAAYLRSDENHDIGLFLFIGLVSLACSFPPFLDLGILKVNFPSAYLHKFFPMFRAYARFGLFVMLSVSVLAAFGMKGLFGVFKKKWKKDALTALILSCVIFEFANAPPLQVTGITNIPEVYQWLGRQNGDFIIVEYPMTEGGAGEAHINYDFFYYQMFHGKKMFSGSYPGSKAYQAREKVLRIASPMTPGYLKGLGIRYVIFHKDLYRKGSYPSSVDVLGEVPELSAREGLKLIKTFGDDAVYEVTAAPMEIGKESV